MRATSASLPRLVVLSLPSLRGMLHVRLAYKTSGGSGQSWTAQFLQIDMHRTPQFTCRVGVDTYPYMLHTIVYRLQ